MRRFAPLLLPIAFVGAARADGGECHAVEVDFTPRDGDLQIVAWIEDTAGTYVDTAYITQETGTYGLGNRPGRFDFNSAPLWPYGRRVTTFPIWAHAHGLTFPEVIFQDELDNDLSHSGEESSVEHHYCQPQYFGSQYTDVDALSCATTRPQTDKGKLAATPTSLYPPRADLTRDPGSDSEDVDQYAALNPFDSVSQATPSAGAATVLSWSPPATVPDGDYLLLVEVSKQFDQNSFYSIARYPAPQVPYGNAGQPYRGQPSVLYRVPFTIGADQPAVTTDAYAGYGDPDGNDGVVRDPDSTITTAGDRLELTSGYRVRVQSHSEDDSIPPAVATNLSVATGSGDVATFTAPGDDGTSGRVASYDLHLAPGAPMTESTFEAAPTVASPASLVSAGQTQTVALENLLPDTDYSFGVRAIDDCGNAGPIAIVPFHTAAETGSVDACFIATAAYGSVMAEDVTLLRRFRDAMLRRSALGELVVETYYTFGPPVAHVVGASEPLRASARDALAPIVADVHALGL